MLFITFSRAECLIRKSLVIIWLCDIELLTIIQQPTADRCVQHSVARKLFGSRRQQDICL